MGIIHHHAPPNRRGTIPIPMKTKHPSEFRLVPLRDARSTADTYDTPERIWEYIQANIEQSPQADPTHEQFVVILLNFQRRITGHLFLSTGTQDTLLVHPADVFRAAIVSGASAIVCVHNHPSGDPSPSDADVKVTRDFIRGGNLLKIQVFDHVVWGNLCVGYNDAPGFKRFDSLRELGYWSI